ncbi:MAG: nucleotide exchange factor GrpE [Candidatus Eremiobacteraeota bacterium]|nr:nucleotide exchange factor GrpE [Candidatus Eremiobacteraeota bacterium]MBV9646781.1 nucleotide exchange factor GrpE [Candidatus Eremiobacteraeota bacterium]
METDATPSAQADVADTDGAAQSAAPTDDPAVQLAEANARADDNHAKLLYALADFENYRKRNERFLQERLSFGRRATLSKFLPVLDNLERALGYGEDTKGLRDGLDATRRGFEALLSSEDVKPIDVVGAPFDPRIAEAIGTKETNDVADNTVIEEVQRGYRIGDDVLRPAHVIVSRRPAAGDAEAAPY